MPHPARWDPDDLDVEISAKDRDGKEQHITLRADLPSYSPLVAVAADRNLNRALREAKHELIRQIEDHKSMREPKHNRQLRKKTTQESCRIRLPAPARNVAARQSCSTARSSVCSLPDGRR